MAYNVEQDPLLEIAAGNVAGRSVISKFGRSQNVESGVLGDIWDQGVGGTTWVAPQAARKHEIYSSNAGDANGGTGAGVLRLYGLPDWDSAEVNEVVTMAGTVHVTTVNSYVIIHRMSVTPEGGAQPNIGRISAVAQTDGTTTAIILATEGQTQMAIYGIPSTQKLFLNRMYANLIAAKTGSEVKIKLVVNPNPDDQLPAFVVKHTLGLRAAGNSNVENHWHTYKKVEGPAIIKIQALGDDNDMDVDAGFEGVIINN